MSDLVRRGQGSPLARVEVGVLTKANPIAGLLRVTRTIIQRTPSLRNLFMQARSEAWAPERLANLLFEGITTYFDGPVPEDPVNVRAVADYLADEYAQLGDSILLISADTGRAIAKLRDEDFYQPSMVPREDGTMVTPGRRIRPEIESFIVQWQFDRAYEQKIESSMLAKLPRTALLAESGDRRVLFATRQGRKVLVSEVGARLPHILPDSCTGSTKALFDYLRVVKEPPTEAGYVSLGEVTHHATASYPLADKKAKNLRYDIWSSILATTASGWARRLAGAVVAYGPDQEATDVTIGYLRDQVDINFWVCSPNVAIALTGRRSKKSDILPVGVTDKFAVGFKEPCGYVVIDESSYDIKDREVFDRWEVATSFRATVWVRWDLIQAFRIHDVPFTGLSVELV